MGRLCYTSAMQSAEAEKLASDVAQHLIDVPGVVAVTLGGSRARGTHRPDSDLDLGIYYRAGEEPDMRALRGLAAELDDRGDGEVVTEPGAWGPWVNGGAWLRIDGSPVDWLYRDLDRVQRVLDDCFAGRVSCDHCLGYVQGFHNHIYLAESHDCIVLADPEGALEAVRRRVASYPAALRETIVRRYGVDARFMLDNGRKGARAGDVFYGAGCLFQCAGYLVQVLHALNGRYFSHDKGGLAATREFELQPAAFQRRVEELLSNPGADAAQLLCSYDSMGVLIDEVQALAS